MPELYKRNLINIHCQPQINPTSNSPSESLQIKITNIKIIGRIR